MAIILHAGNGKRMASRLSFHDSTRAKCSCSGVFYRVCSQANPIGYARHAKHRGAEK